MKKSYNDAQEKVEKLMALLVEYPRYEMPRDVIKKSINNLGLPTIRQFAGSIGAASCQLFFEHGVAKNAHEKQAIIIAMHKLTAFWPRKPAPKTNQILRDLNEFDAANTTKMENAA